MSSISKERLFLIYPETDGEPMAENTLQFEWIVLIKLGLEACFVDRDDVFIAGDLFWYPLEGNPKVRLAPDVMVAFGRPKGHRGSYLQWLEKNIAPQVVFEILSPGNRAKEMERKFEFYQRYGVQEYYIYDPDKNILEGHLRKGGLLAPIPEKKLKDWISPLLGVRFEWSPKTLRLYQPNGNRFLSYLELLKSGEEAMAELQEKRRLLSQAKAHILDAEQRADTAEQRADTAEQRADTAEQRAETAEQRAGKLAERLRQLGIDPDEI
jgi:Uma2 family endonuclease